MIRLSGMVSGLDTDAIVSALMSSYNLQKDNLVKAQTKLSWKQDAWKTMNQNIYGFYTGSLKDAQYSKNYNLKTASVSNPEYAKVTASAQAVNGEQTLEVLELASTGYLTGGEIKHKDAAKQLTGSSKLSDIADMAEGQKGSVNVTVDGKTRTFEISSDMTINQLVVQLKESGLNASFDDNNQRFYISAATSGAKHDFSLTANDENGRNMLKSAGILSLNKADLKEYQTWAEYATDSTKLNAAVDAEYAKKALKYEDKAKEYAKIYNDALSKRDAAIKDNGSRSELADKLNVYNNELNKYSAYIKKDEEGNDIKDANGVYEYDEEKIKADFSEDEYKSYQTFHNNAKNISKLITQYDTATDTMDKYKDMVHINADGKAEAATAENDSAKYDALKADVDTQNQKIKDDIMAQFTQRAQYAASMVDADGWKSGVTGSTGAVRIIGKDAQIKLNGADYVSNTNNFSINGLTIQATAKTEPGKSVTITTNTDTDAIYNKIKGFLKDYNNLIKTIDTAYNAASSKGYEPLTKDEKEAMTDDEIKEWEKKIKDSLLRKDSILGAVSSSLKTDMMSVFEINGKKYSLSSFGISTLSYFESSENEKGVYHIDGDSDDSNTSGKDDKLRAAIAQDPDTVISFFTQLSQKMYKDITKRMETSSLSSVYTIYNDKELAREYSDYKTKISDKTKEIETWENYYYKKFSSMESALATLNSQSSSLTGLLK